MNQGDLSASEMHPETRPFWEAGRAGEFLLRICQDCGRFHWYPRAICPFCFSVRTEWRASGGEGVIYAYSVMRRATPPYAIAYVTLSEGPTMMTNIIDCDIDRLFIGQAVRLAFKPASDGRAIPCFRPVSTDKPPPTTRRG